MIGFGTLFQLFTRRLTLEEAVERVCQRIGIKGRAIVWPYAEPCMDVDKPHQLELLRADLASRQRRQLPSQEEPQEGHQGHKSAKPAAKTGQSKKSENGRKRHRHLNPKAKLKEEMKSAFHP